MEKVEALPKAPVLALPRRRQQRREVQDHNKTGEEKENEKKEVPVREQQQQQQQQQQQRPKQRGGRVEGIPAEEEGRDEQVPRRHRGVPRLRLNGASTSSSSSSHPSQSTQRHRQRQRGVRDDAYYAIASARYATTPRASNSDFVQTARAILQSVYRAPPPSTQQIKKEKKKQGLLEREHVLRRLMRGNPTQGDGFQHHERVVNTTRSTKLASGMLTSRARRPNASLAFQEVCKARGLRTSEFQSTISSGSAEQERGSRRKAEAIVWNGQTGRWLARQNRYIQPELSQAELQSLREVFRTVDADGSGRLDGEEVTTALRLVGFRNIKQVIEELFHKIGKEVDAELTFADFCQLVRVSSAVSPSQGSASSSKGRDKGKGKGIKGGGKEQSVSMSVLLQSVKRKRLMAKLT